MMPAELFDDGWTPDGWRSRAAAQQPDWPDSGELERALDEVRALPPLGWESRHAVFSRLRENSVPS